MILRRTLVTLLASALAATSATVGVNAASDGAEGAAANERIDPLLIAKVAVLREARLENGAQTTNKTQPDTLSDVRGANQDLARQTQITASGDAVLATPTADGVCLGTSRFGNLTCGTAEDAAAGDLAGAIVCSTHLPKDNVAVIALVPDGASEVRVNRGDGSNGKVKVVNNSPALEVTKTETIPVSFSYQLDGRMHSVASQLPSAEDLACKTVHV